MDALVTVMLSHDELNLHVLWGLCAGVAASCGGELERTTRMAHPLHDKILTAISYYQRPMKFRARIFHSEPMTIALLTDLGDENPGLTITNGIEYRGSESRIQALARYQSRAPGDCRALR